MSVFMVFFSILFVQPWFSNPELGMCFMPAFIVFPELQALCFIQSYHTVKAIVSFFFF